MPAFLIIVIKSFTVKNKHKWGRNWSILESPGNLLVSEQKWVDCSGEETDAGQVDGRGDGDGRDRSDGDRLLGIGQVSGAVRAGHDT